jgi:RNA polymerase sigma-70 factor (ECF subfamily)
MDEARLVAQIAAGDRGRPLDELFRRYAKPLYGLGLRLLGDAGLAEEMVQETFVRLWRQAGAYDPARGSVKTFLYTIARRIAIDLWRRPSSRPYESLEDADEADTGTRPHDRVVAEVTVNEALKTLSPAHREVLELSYRGGLLQTEIAAVTGVPVGTVKTRTYYALRALRVALEERDFHG